MAEPTVYRAYGQNIPLIPVFPFPEVWDSAPTASNKVFFPGQVVVYKVNSTTRYMYMYGGRDSSGNAIWIQIGTSSGDLSTLTGTTGGAIAPVAGNITFAAGTGMASIAGTAGTLTFNVNFASPPALGSGTPAAVTGTTVASTGAMTAGTGLTATTGNISATAGSVNAGTSMTATLGNITATNGNLVLGTAGNKIIIPTGSNASAGTSGAMSGTPGVVTVATTACSATAKIFYSRATTGGTPGEVSITAQDGTGFTLTSTGNETSTFNWWIINA